MLLVSLPAAMVQAEGLSFDVRTPVEKITIVKSAAGSLVSIADGSHDVVDDPGSPRVPYRIIQVLLPQGAAIEDVRFVPGDAQLVASGVDVELGREQVSEEGIAGKGATHPGGYIYGRHVGTGYLHGYAIASFAVYPVRVDGGEVTAVDQVTIDVTTRPDGREAAGPRRHRDGFRERVRREVGSMVINPEALDGYYFEEVKVEDVRGFQPTPYPSLEGSPVDYVIITNDSLAAAYQGR
jgi:hypothetical protein